MTDLAHHESFMRRALALARRGWGDTHPNPMVGALIVEGGEVVAEGWHVRAGEPHAEINALRALGRKPRDGATLYVTLEPCCTHGRTPPCTDAIVDAGIARVVVGATDPNPAHAGKGYEVLRAGGVEVVSGVLADECTDLNLVFNHLMTTGRPIFAAKSGVTLDGKVATRTGDSKWITGAPARADGHRWRRLFPAIAVGAGTVRADNPRLTARVGETEWCPWRFVFDGLLRTVTDKAMPGIYTDEFRERTIVVTTPHGGMGYVRKLNTLGVKTWVMPGSSPKVNFGDFRQRCASEGITGIFFEGGAQLLSELPPGPGARLPVCLPRAGPVRGREGQEHPAGAAHGITRPGRPPGACEARDPWRRLADARLPQVSGEDVRRRGGLHAQAVRRVKTQTSCPPC